MKLKLLKSVLGYTVSQGGSKLPGIPYRNTDKRWKSGKYFKRKKKQPKKHLNLD